MSTKITRGARAHLILTVDRLDAPWLRIVRGTRAHDPLTIRKFRAMVDELRRSGKPITIPLGTHLKFVMAAHVAPSSR